MNDRKLKIEQHKEGYVFPSTAAQNCHILHGLTKKQQNFILSQFWRPEVGRAVLPLEAPAEISFLLLPTSGGLQPSLQLDCSNFCPFPSVCLSLPFLRVCVSPMRLQRRHLKLNLGLPGLFKMISSCDP